MIFTKNIDKDLSPSLAEHAELVFLHTHRAARKIMEWGCSRRVEKRNKFTTPRPNEAVLNGEPLFSSCDLSRGHNGRQPRRKGERRESQRAFCPRSSWHKMKVSSWHQFYKWNNLVSKVFLTWQRSLSYWQFYAFYGLLRLSWWQRVPYCPLQV